MRRPFQTFHAEPAAVSSASVLDHYLQRIRTARRLPAADEPVYRNDLAYIQHRGFSEFARSASPGLLNIFRRAGITTGHVVDLGCGDGTWLRMLTQHGFA